MPTPAGGKNHKKCKSAVRELPHGTFMCQKTPILPYKDCSSPLKLRLHLFRQVCRGRIYASRAVSQLYRIIGTAAAGGIYAAPTSQRFIFILVYGRGRGSPLQCTFWVWGHANCSPSHWCSSSRMAANAAAVSGSSVLKSSSRHSQPCSSTMRRLSG